MERSETAHWKNVLRRERLQRNWRQRDLAEHLHTTALTVHRWERGSQRPGADYRFKLCALFGKSAEELGFCAAQPATDEVVEATPFSMLEVKPGRPAAPETETAEELMLRVLHIRARELGPDHPLTAISLTILAQIYQEQEIDRRTEPQARRSLEVCKRLLGRYHPDTATCLQQLARCSHHQGQHAAAERYYHQALTIREELFGKEHLSVGETLCGLAALYQAQNRIELAITSYQRSLTIAEHFFGSPQTSRAQMTTGYAALLRKRGQPSILQLEVWHALNT